MQVQRLAQEGVFGTAPTPSTAVAAGTRAYSTTAMVNKAKLQGPFEIVRSTIAAHGLKGLWLGQTGTLFRETGGSAAWFGAYEAVSRAFISVKQAQASSLGSDAKITKKDLSTLQLMAAGACAGMSYNIVLFPADCVKSAMQTQEELRPRQRGPDGKSIGEGPKFWGVAKRIYQSRGIRGLYAGCGVTVARAAPSSAMIFLIYESLESRFGNLFA
jgi:ornithine carrier protein